MPALTRQIHEREIDETRFFLDYGAGVWVGRTTGVKVGMGVLLGRSVAIAIPGVAVQTGGRLFGALLRFRWIKSRS